MKPWVYPILDFKNLPRGGKRVSQKFHPTFKIGSSVWRAKELLIEVFSKKGHTHGFVPLWGTLQITPMWDTSIIKHSQSLDCVLHVSHIHFRTHNFLTYRGTNLHTEWKIECDISKIKHMIRVNRKVGRRHVGTPCFHRFPSTVAG